MKKIAVDAMGGDNAPQALVEGVNQAIRDFDDIEIVLYGDEAKIKDYLTATEYRCLVGSRFLYCWAHQGRGTSRFDVDTSNG